MTNFEEILNRGFDELPEPKPLPNGKYLLKGRFAGAFEYENKDTGDVGARISITDEVVKPYDADTAAAAEAELGKDGWKGKAVESTFYVTNMEEERKVWDHLAKRGIEVNGKSLEDALKEVRGTTIVGSVRTRNYEDKDGNAAWRNFTVKTEPVSL